MTLVMEVLVGVYGFVVTICNNLPILVFNEDI